MRDRILQTGLNIISLMKREVLNMELKRQRTHTFRRLDEELRPAKLILRFVDMDTSQYPFHSLFLIARPTRPRFFGKNCISV